MPSEIKYLLILCSLRGFKVLGFFPFSQVESEARSEVRALWDYIISFQFLFLLGGKMKAQEVIPFYSSFQMHLHQLDQRG